MHFLVLKITEVNKMTISRDLWSTDPCRKRQMINKWISIMSYGAKCNAKNMHQGAREAAAGVGLKTLIKGDQRTSLRWHLNRNLMKVLSVLHKCLGEECSRQRKEVKKTWNWNRLDIFDSLVKKEAPYVSMNHCYLHQYMLAPKLVFHRESQKLNRIETSISWGFTKKWKQNVMLLVHPNFMISHRESLEASG